MLTTLLSILTNRILWSFLGVTALAAVIWMIGPLLSIVDTRPLESEQNRIISIAVVYLLWAQGHYSAAPVQRLAEPQADG